MAFNLPKVLKVLLFSSSQPLTVKDIQAAFARFHELPLAPVADGPPREVASMAAVSVATTGEELNALLRALARVRSSKRRRAE